MTRGLTHIYTGEGKGKTTAAMGLALRALGAGLQVRIFQFMKNQPTGEMASLAKLAPGILRRADCDVRKFTWDMTPAEKETWAEAQQTLFDEACDAACDKDVDLVVLDEALGAVGAGAIGEDQLLYLIGHKYRGTELVITGRGASERLIALADYVTEMRMLRHPYAAGIPARKGIEY
jgi:cob(I)alamin adenosyltransferase